MPEGALRTRTQARLGRRGASRGTCPRHRVAASSTCPSPATVRLSHQPSPRGPDPDPTSLTPLTHLARNPGTREHGSHAGARIPQSTRAAGTRAGQSYCPRSAAQLRQRAEQRRAPSPRRLSASHPSARPRRSARGAFQQNRAAGASEPPLESISRTCSPAGRSHIPHIPPQ